MWQDFADALIEDTSGLYGGTSRPVFTELRYSAKIFVVFFISRKWYIFAYLKRNFGRLVDTYLE